MARFFVPLSGWMAANYRGTPVTKMIIKDVVGKFKSTTLIPVLVDSVGESVL